MDPPQPNRTLRLSNVISAKARNHVIATIRARHRGTWDALYYGWRDEFRSAGLTAREASRKARDRSITEIQFIYPEEWISIREQRMNELRTELHFVDARPAANKARKKE